MVRQMKRCCASGVLLILLSFVLIVQARAQQVQSTDFPQRPITFVVLFGPGGTQDLSSRKLASLVEKELKQPVVIENKVGGSGVIGENVIAKAKPDGYTIGSLSFSCMTLIPHMREVPYHPQKDFSFIAQSQIFPQPFCVRSDAPWKTFGELLEYARKNPGKVTYSTAGPGGAQHLFMEWLAKRENIKLVHVPFKGGADGVSAVLGGHVVGSLAAEVAAQIKTGSVRALAVLGEKRLKGLPDVPTFSEIGYKIEMPNWMGIGGPRGIPQPILKKLEAAFTKAIHDPSFNEFLETMMMTRVYRNSEEFEKFAYSQYELARDIVASAGMLKK